VVMTVSQNRLIEFLQGYKIEVVVGYLSRGLLTPKMFLVATWV
jgi:hypothetical protein